MTRIEISVEHIQPCFTNADKNQQFLICLLITGDTHPSLSIEESGLAINASKTVSKPSFPIGFFDKLHTHNKLIT